MTKRVWLCVHNELADECTSCEEEDWAVNGTKSVLCDHELIDLAERCVTCGEIVDE